MTGDFPIPRHLVSDRPGELILLRVPGDAHPDDGMTAVGIKPGDWMVVHQCDAADAGEIAVTVSDGAVHVQTLEEPAAGPDLTGVVTTIIFGVGPPSGKQA